MIYSTQQIECYKLSLKNLRGQGYDGGSNMSGRKNGVQALILEDQPLAVYTHCFNHQLNLCIFRAREVQAIRNLVGIIGTVSVFFIYICQKNKYYVGHYFKR